MSFSYLHPYTTESRIWNYNKKYIYVYNILKAYIKIVKKNNLTLRQTSKIIEQTPNIGSQKVISFTWLTTLVTASIKESLLPLKPSNVPNWDVPIIIAAALVNPEITGMLTNCTRNPKRNNPINVITQPVRKHRSTWESKRFACCNFRKLSHLL